MPEVLYMRHCCQFKADEVYCLSETSLSSSRTLALGFCPVCGKPVAELVEFNFAGGMNKISAAGLNAQALMQSVKEDIKYSLKQLNFKNSKSKPYGWRYGINKEYRNGVSKQFACDFYGNKEEVKKSKSRK